MAKQNKTNPVRFTSLEKVVEEQTSSRKQLITGVYCDRNGFSIALIQVSECLESFTLLKLVSERKSTVASVRAALNQIKLDYPKLRKIHYSGTATLGKALAKIQSTLYCGGSLVSDLKSVQAEIVGDIQKVEVDPEDLEFTLNSLWSDRNLECHDQETNLFNQIKGYKVGDRNTKLFALYVGITDVQPIKYQKFFFTTARI